MNFSPWIKKQEITFTDAEIVDGIGTGAVGICEPSTAKSITCDYLTNSHI